ELLGHEESAGRDDEKGEDDAHREDQDRFAHAVSPPRALRVDLQDRPSWSGDEDGWLTRWLTFVGQGWKPGEPIDLTCEEAVGRWEWCLARGEALPYSSAHRRKAASASSPNGTRTTDSIVSTASSGQRMRCRRRTASVPRELLPGPGGWTPCQLPDSPCDRRLGERHTFTKNVSEAL